MSGTFEHGRLSHLSHKSAAVDSNPAADAASGTDEPSERSEPVEEERLSFMLNSGECRLMRAINEVLSYNSRMCSTGCLYSMDELIPTGYLLIIEEQNKSWFRMQLSASSQSVKLWYADFSTRLQESLDEEARGRLFRPDSCHVFAGAKRQKAGAPLHCRRFAYLPTEVLHHPSLMLHQLPISPDQLLLIDHACQAAAYVPVIVGFADQSDRVTTMQ